MLDSTGLKVLIIMQQSNTIQYNLDHDICHPHAYFLALSLQQTREFSIITLKGSFINLHVLPSFMSSPPLPAPMFCLETVSFFLYYLLHILVLYFVIYPSGHYTYIKSQPTLEHEKSLLCFILENRSSTESLYYYS